MTERGLTLPDTIALFPLRDATLFPRARLPLNIFEPRYLAMTDHALGHGRIIGMIRPRYDDDVNPPLYSIGCAGKIVAFSETGDGRYLIELAGLSRFRLLTEGLSDGNFRLGEVDWSPYTSDLAEPQEDLDAEREPLLSRLSAYLDSVGLSADWDTIEGASMETIVSSVAMSCPFEADEMQALLEAPSLPERINTLSTLMEIATAEAIESDGQDTLSRMQ
ncbi:MAG: LON peptidase substrate-binding domain-containing protein [Pseudomonadota bacterium]